ncbi:MAG TPA: NUDIX domain-containing protein [Candidatus Nanopelagicales bacterium]|nr:NUDIX domain-containing protein [Candidatus Nanopelagicales bacterium]
MTDERPVIRRRAARVVALSPQGRVLLFEGGDPDRPHVRIWHTPGGGVDPGEDDRAAAVREYREETGADIEVGAHVWDRELRFGFNGALYDQVEVFFVAYVDEHVADTSGHNEIEQLYLGEHRWFSVDDLRALPRADGSVLVAPPDIADRVADLLRDGPPATPVRVEGVVLP